MKDQILEVAQAMQKILPEDITIAYFSNGKGAVYLSPKVASLVMGLVRASKE